MAGVKLKASGELEALVVMLYQSQAVAVAEIDARCS